MKRFRRNEPVAFVRCDGCSYEHTPSSGLPLAARASAVKHHIETGHEIRVEITQTLWLPATTKKEG